MTDRQNRVPSVALGALLTAVCATDVLADELPLAAIVPSNVQFFEGSGASTALAGDVLVIGSPGYDIGTELSIGRASVHRWDGVAWVEEQVLEPIDGEDYDEFGKSVALTPDGHWLAVGAPGDDNGGSVFLYRHGAGGWTLETQLSGPSAAPWDEFGFAVACGPDLLLVGAPGRDVPPNNGAGMTYAYRLGPGGWAFEAALTITGFSGANGRYGAAIAIDADTAVIGGPHTFQFSSPFGMVHLQRFDGSAWTRVDSIKGQGLVSSGGDFGHAVAIDGDRILVGAPDDNTNAGSAFTFVEDVSGDWSLEQELNDGAGQPGDRFGSAVALDDDQLVVAAPFGALAGGPGGAGVLFRLDGGGTWQPLERLMDPSAKSPDQLGVSAALDGDLIVLGAASYANADTSHGAALVFDLLEPAWTWLGQGLAGQAGTPVLQPQSSLVGGQPITLEVRHAAPSAATALVAGLTSVGLPLKGGVLVPSPDVLIIGLSTDGAGELLLASTWPSGVPAGFDVSLQAWIADATGPVGFTASHGVRGTTP